MPTSVRARVLLLCMVNAGTRKRRFTALAGLRSPNYRFSWCPTPVAGWLLNSFSTLATARVGG